MAASVYCGTEEEFVKMKDMSASRRSKRPLFVSAEQCMYICRQSAETRCIGFDYVNNEFHCIIYYSWELFSFTRTSSAPGVDNYRRLACTLPTSGMLGVYGGGGGGIPQGAVLRPALFARNRQRKRARQRTT